VTVRHTIGQKCSTRSLKVPIVFLFLWLSVVSWIDFWPIMVWSNFSDSSLIKIFVTNAMFLQTYIFLKILR
jgi:hypothetical protein